MDHVQEYLSPDFHQPLPFQISSPFADRNSCSLTLYSKLDRTLFDPDIHAYGSLFRAVYSIVCNYNEPRP